VRSRCRPASIEFHPQPRAPSSVEGKPTGCRARCMFDTRSDAGERAVARLLTATRTCQIQHTPWPRLHDRCQSLSSTASDHRLAATQAAVALRTATIIECTDIKCSSLREPSASYGRTCPGLHAASVGEGRIDSPLAGGRPGRRGVGRAVFRTSIRGSTGRSWSERRPLGSLASRCPDAMTSVVSVRPCLWH